ncbi:hypothetical protein HK100_006331, partial [Physocladia obscura]
MLKFESTTRCGLCKSYTTDSVCVKPCGHNFCRICIFEFIAVHEKHCPCALNPLTSFKPSNQKPAKSISYARSSRTVETCTILHDGILTEPTAITGDQDKPATTATGSKMFGFLSRTNPLKTVELQDEALSQPKLALESAPSSPVSQLESPQVGDKSCEPSIQSKSYWNMFGARTKSPVLMEHSDPLLACVTVEINLGFMKKFGKFCLLVEPQNQPISGKYRMSTDNGTEYLTTLRWEHDGTACKSRESLESTVSVSYIWDSPETHRIVKKLNSRFRTASTFELPTFRSAMRQSLPKFDLLTEQTLVQ